jgi:hypothetical protein
LKSITVGPFVINIAIAQAFPLFDLTSKVRMYGGSKSVELGPCGSSCTIEVEK